MVELFITDIFLPGLTQNSTFDVNIKFEWVPIPTDYRTSLLEYFIAAITRIIVLFFG